MICLTYQVIFLQINSVQQLNKVIDMKRKFDEKKSTQDFKKYF